MIRGRSSMAEDRGCCTAGGAGSIPVGSSTPGHITREAFIADHVSRCTAQPCRKYDRSKPNGGGYHSLEYSRRKCAKGLWRKAQQAHTHNRGGRR